MAGHFGWQMTKKNVIERNQYLMETGQLSDCRFIVGVDPHQQILPGHKLILAMSSPVFGVMFYGGVAETDSIIVRDVSPDTFKALLEYIYTDIINLNTFDQVTELYFAAKKFMLPHLVKKCTKYIEYDINPKNACKSREVDKPFEEPLLMGMCRHNICSQSKEVQTEASFDNGEISKTIPVINNQ